MSSDRGTVGIAALGAVAVGVVIIAFIMGVTLLLGIGPWVTVNEGYVGVQTERGAATGEVYEPGWSMQKPIVQGYEEIETRDRTVDMRGEESIYVITEDGQDVWVDVTVRYSVEEDKAVTFFQEARSHDQAVDRFIEPTVRSDMRDEASTLGARDIITKDGRQGLEEAALGALRENLDGTGMTVETVQVRDVDLNEEFSGELEQVEIEETRAEQRKIEAQGQAEARIEEAEGNAEAEIIEAEGEAQAMEIKDENLTEKVLAHEQIKAYDDGTVYVTDGDQEMILDTEESDD